MRRHAPLLFAVVLATVCEKKPSTTPDDAADDGAADDGGDDGGDDADEEGENEEGADRPPPVEQLLKIEGPLPESAITQMQQDLLNELRDCLDEALQSPDGLTLNGAVVVKLTVDKAGAVTSSMVELDEVGHKPSATCLAKVVEGYKFPKQKGESVVHWPVYSNNF